ncbi:UNKNOWN [Stylonychia lemnae]|uniref:Uncharacterized protein n=1 Tax=Stylonychia lemnae TaxID=5949 RepID=A0A077ZW22_STYLE|nr:UNKNOWN [Stylonychia lemnae]|eukprot:CDW73460.1 UNKNOWN [Stylonychia lemnae]
MAIQNTTTTSENSESQTGGNSQPEGIVNLEYGMDSQQPAVPITSSGIKEAQEILRKREMRAQKAQMVKQELMSTSATFNLSESGTQTQKKSLYKANQFCMDLTTSIDLNEVGQVNVEQEQGGSSINHKTETIEQMLEKHIQWKNRVDNCLYERWNNSFCVDAKNKKIQVQNYLNDLTDSVSTSQGLKHFLHYDAAQIKAKVNRIPAIAKKLDIAEELVQERLSFLVTLTETLDKLIFQDNAKPTDITIGGEGGYRIKVDSNEQVEVLLKQLDETPGQQPWGISKSYKIKGLTVHTFIDMRYKVERFSTIF